MTRRPRAGTRTRLLVLPSIPDELDDATKDALAVRNACAVDGRCPVCGARPEVQADRELPGVYHATFRHDDRCPALHDPEAAA